VACYHECYDNERDIHGTVEFRGWMVNLEGGTERGEQVKRRGTPPFVRATLAKSRATQDVLKTLRRGHPRSKGS
jgi:hypothetical protein